jgi:UDP-N-acetylglucosamine--N-acetylmuramyl-(pentapeptide) pyrophosphoryl-undecaprenol N-acetylglucosamine transferase
VRRLLAVSVDGGHLVELHQLVPRIADLEGPVDWVTFDTPQSRSLLAGEHVRHVPTLGARDLGTLAKVIRPAGRTLRSGGYTDVIGSGSVSLAYLPLARAFGLRAHYVECATRTDGTSETGRLLEAVPGVSLYTQHPAQASRRWLYRGSVFDAYEPAEAEPPGPLRRVVVTVGMNPYPFRRLFERLVAILPADVEVVWQTGHTDVSGLPIDARPMLASHELDEAMRDADVVIAHAGTGSSLQALDNGKLPILVPRVAALGEQTDEHQPPLVEELAGRGLAIGATVETLTLELVESAVGRRVKRRDAAPPFVLEGGG